MRVRPTNDREHSLGAASCVQAVSGTTLRVSCTPEPHVFAFDHVAQQDASQESVFRGRVCTCVWLGVGLGVGSGRHSVWFALSSCSCLSSAAHWVAAVWHGQARSVPPSGPFHNIGPPSHARPPAAAGQHIVENCLRGFNGCIFVSRRGCSCAGQGRAGRGGGVYKGHVAAREQHTMRRDSR